MEAEASADCTGSSDTRGAPRFVLHWDKGTGSLYPHVEQLLDTGYPWRGDAHLHKAAHFGQGTYWRGQQPALPTARGQVSESWRGSIWAVHHRQHPPRPGLPPQLLSLPHLEVFSKILWSLSQETSKTKLVRHTSTSASTTRAGFRGDLILNIPLLCYLFWWPQHLGSLPGEVTLRAVGPWTLCSFQTVNAALFTVKIGQRTTERYLRASPGDMTTGWVWRPNRLIMSWSWARTPFIGYPPYNFILMGGGAQWSFGSSDININSDSVFNGVQNVWVFLIPKFMITGINSVGPSGEDWAIT